MNKFVFSNAEISLWPMAFVFSTGINGTYTFAPAKQKWLSTPKIIDWWKAR